ncbi:hypothetical protein niasHT_022333 [Heterodera trifolii]|uniref:Uncharacterized protein n=1 Tax=Heterodera trifolii TaxID=157864 RepID=A0ABD2KPJ2_9BILA
MPHLSHPFPNCAIVVSYSPKCHPFLTHFPIVPLSFPIPLFQNANLFHSFPNCAIVVSYSPKCHPFSHSFPNCAIVVSYSPLSKCHPFLTHFPIVPLSFSYSLNATPFSLISQLCHCRFPFPSFKMPPLSHSFPNCAIVVSYSPKSHPFSPISNCAIVVSYSPKCHPFLTHFPIVPLSFPIPLNATLFSPISNCAIVVSYSPKCHPFLTHFPIVPSPFPIPLFQNATPFSPISQLCHCRFLFP